MHDRLPRRSRHRDFSCRGCLPGCGAGFARSHSGAAVVLVARLVWLLVNSRGPETFIVRVAASNRLFPRSAPGEGCLLEYLCDWCRKPKRPGADWILGFAAEKLGPASARREITITDSWSDKWAGHPLAVHFCSERHKQKYIDALFRDPVATPSRRRRRAAVALRAGALSAREVDSVVGCNGGATEFEPGDVPQVRRQRRRRKPGFNTCDDLRAHGLGIRLDGSSARSTSTQQRKDLAGDAKTQ